ncbi:MAG: hypothetical protein KDD22_03765, partial [Bdellovibrionales bacterium]|nr:hypothetical protein [Bdellovibrionales bacterium]
MISALPTNLVDLIGDVSKALGDCIKRQEPERFVEGYISILKTVESTSDLYRLKAQLEKAKKTDLYKLVHAFGLHLELINCCENAYRSHRILQKDFRVGESENPLSFVLTAHPTEARHPETLVLLEKLTEFLRNHLTAKTSFNWIAVETAICQLWNLPLAKNKKPEVRDEAEQIHIII